MRVITSCKTCLPSLRSLGSFEWWRPKTLCGEEKNRAMLRPCWSKTFCRQHAHYYLHGGVWISQLCSGHLLQLLLGMSLAVTSLEMPTAVECTKKSHKHVPANFIWTGKERSCFLFSWGKTLMGITETGLYVHNVRGVSISSSICGRRIAMFVLFLCFLKDTAHPVCCDGSCWK